MSYSVSTNPITPVKLSFDSEEKFWMLVHVLWTNYDKPFDQGSWNKCSAGHITKDKWFNNKGLHKNKTNWCTSEPLYKLSYSFDALEEFFNVNERTISQIFGSCVYVYSIEEAVTRIESWLLKCEKLKVLE